jgi:hypothetical protein
MLDPASTCSSTKSNRRSNCRRCSYFVPLMFSQGVEIGVRSKGFLFERQSVTSFAMPLLSLSLALLRFAAPRGASDVIARRIEHLTMHINPLKI